MPILSTYRCDTSQVRCWINYLSIPITGKTACPEMAKTGQENCFFQSPSYRLYSESWPNSQTLFLVMPLPKTGGIVLSLEELLGTSSSSSSSSRPLRPSLAISANGLALVLISTK